MNRVLVKSGFPKKHQNEQFLVVLFREKEVRAKSVTGELDHVCKHIKGHPKEPWQFIDIQYAKLLTSFAM